MTKKKNKKMNNILTSKDEVAKRRIRVTNITYDSTADEIKQIFSSAGEVLSLDLLKDESYLFKGTALVTFKETGIIEKAIGMFDLTEFKGRKVVVMKEEFFLDSHKVKGSYSRNSSYGQYEDSGNTYGLSWAFLNYLEIDLPLVNTVFASNLDPTSTESSLKDIFSLAGNILDIQIFRDKEGKSLGYGVVEYEHPLAAVQAISMLHRKTYKTRRLYVRMYRHDFDYRRLPAGLKAVGMGLGVDGKPVRDFNPYVGFNSIATSNSLQYSVATDSLNPSSYRNSNNYSGHYYHKSGFSSKNSKKGNNFNHKTSTTVTTSPSPNSTNSDHQINTVYLDNIDTDALTNKITSGVGFLMDNMKEKVVTVAEEESLATNLEAMSLNPEEQVAPIVVEDAADPSPDTPDALNKSHEEQLPMSSIGAIGSNYEEPSTFSFSSMMVSGNPKEIIGAIGETSYVETSRNNLGTLENNLSEHSSSSILTSGGINEVLTTNDIPSSNSSQFSEMSALRNVIVINNLPVYYNSKMLEDLCWTFGDVEAAVLKSTGTGVVKFKSQSDAEMAVQMLDDQPLEGWILRARTF